jgi:hypothetical protein
MVFPAMYRKPHRSGAAEILRHLGGVRHAWHLRRKMLKSPLTIRIYSTSLQRWTHHKFEPHCKATSNPIARLIGRLLELDPTDTAFHVFSECLSFASSCLADVLFGVLRLKV